MGTTRFHALLIATSLLASACATTPPISSSAQTQPFDITRIETLRHFQATEVAPILRDICGVNAVAEPKLNLIIIKGSKDAVQSASGVVKYINDIIVEDFGPAIFIYTLRNASAPDVASILNTMIQNDFFPSRDSQSPGHAIAVIADPRTNTLIVRLDDPTLESHIKTIIDKLDRPLSPLQPPTTVPNSYR